MSSGQLLSRSAASDGKSYMFSLISFGRKVAGKLLGSRSSDHQSIRGEFRFQMSEIGSGNMVDSETRAEWVNIKPGHEKLWVWQKADKLYFQIMIMCRNLPVREKYNLRSQIERSAKSVKDNIAEGNESYYYKDKMKGFYTARKETSETQSHLRDFEKFKCAPVLKIQQMIDEYEEIKRGINGLINRASQRSDASPNRGERSI
jgi:four helix bundle protein